MSFWFCESLFARERGVLRFQQVVFGGGKLLGAGRGGGKRTRKML